MHGKQDCAKALFRRRCDLHVVDFDRHTALFYAVRRADEATALWLLGEGAAMEMQDRVGNSPQSIAQELGLSEVMRVMKMLSGEKKSEKSDGAPV
mmetsp:Transcript_76314/g.247122  ORF Transcript_76314/g.247122 Transcript_76314/m.247122 type:complete len:95 (+) Transcript_76314:768-1052(+)